MSEMYFIYTNTFKYHVSCTDGKVSVRIKIGITFIFRFHYRPIQIVVFFLVGVSLLSQHFQKVLLDVET